MRYYMYTYIYIYIQICTPLSAVSGLQASIQPTKMRLSGPRTRLREEASSKL